MKKKIFAIVVLYFLLCQGIAQADYPFSITRNRELLFLGLGSTLSFSGYLLKRQIKAPKVENLDRQNLFTLDQIAVNMNHEKTAVLSDITLITDICMPLFLIDEHQKRSLLMYTESLFLVFGTTYIVKSLFHRPRPYVYRWDEIHDGKLTGEAAASFFSGHTALAFNGALFTGYVYQKCHPGSRWVKPIWIGGISMAVATGIFRITSAKHFPTDVIAGAVFGSMTGWLIPRLHEEEFHFEGKRYNDKSSSNMLVGLSLGIAASIFVPQCYRHGENILSIDFNQGINLYYHF